jgi:hypothetical protein
MEILQVESVPSTIIHQLAQSNVKKMSGIMRVVLMDLKKSKHISNKENSSHHH